MCPAWATRENCPANCMCCTAYEESKTGRAELAAEAARGGAADSDYDTTVVGQCLMCDHEYRCVDHDGDGDGECVYQADYNYNGTNMCDWWLWAFNYGYNQTLTNWKNGHDYDEGGALWKKYYTINGKNCSRPQI